MNHPPDQAGFCPECSVNLDYEKHHCFDDLTPISGTDTLIPEGEGVTSMRSSDTYRPFQSSKDR